RVTRPAMQARRRGNTPTPGTASGPKQSAGRRRRSESTGGRMHDGIPGAGRALAANVRSMLALGAAVLLAASLCPQSARSADDVVLTEKGLGPLAAGTTLDVAKAAAVSERFEAEPFQAGSEGMAMPAVALVNRKGV